MVSITGALLVSQLVLVEPESATSIILTYSIERLIYTYFAKRLKKYVFIYDGVEFVRFSTPGLSATPASGGQTAIGNFSFLHHLLHYALAIYYHIEQIHSCRKQREIKYLSI